MDGGAQYIRSLEFAKLLIPQKFQFGKVHPNTTRAIFLAKQIACSRNRLLVLKQLFTAQCWRALWQSTQGLQQLPSLDIMMLFNIYIFPAPPTH